MSLYTRDILGVRVDFGLTKKDFLDKVEFAIKNQLESYICTINPEFIMHSLNDPKFQKELNASYLNVPDGAGILMAERYLSLVENSKYNLNEQSNFSSFILKLFLGLNVGFSSFLNLKKLGPKLPGSELIYDMCSFAQKKSYTVMFLGGWARDSWGRPMPTSGNLSGQSAKKLQEMFPGLKVILASSEVQFEKQYDEKTLNVIQKGMEESKVSRVDIVFIASDHRKQESWMQRNLNKIPANLGIGVGGTFEFVTGYTQRASKLMTTVHLEWLQRLYKEPWRVKRVPISFPLFPLKIFISSLVKKK
ncbi:WecB/TagA/CpsF family glycosyltransferase [candidate division WWE3 bacterium]|nr:WecB/TagA/CpsF family glycosyltransferase [candidate division WWE3 bacterium]